MFEPPRCPYVTCPRHTNPRGRFFTRRGFYRAACRSHPVPRFRCKTCQRSFSRQTFRADFRDRKPHHNLQVIKNMCSGVGFRQSARMIGLTRNNLEAKARKISRNARRLDINLKGRAATKKHTSPGTETQEIHFDEFETYETRRNTRPLSIAVLIESRTRFIVAAMAAPIRPKGMMTKRRLAAIGAEDVVFGPRRDRSRLVCRSAFRRAAKLRPGLESVILRSDEKSTYPSYLAEAYRGRAITHLRTPSIMHRGKRNPLFAINHTEAIARNLVGRLIRQMWLVSKARQYLNLHLGLYGAWRNWVRPRFNRDTESPGQLAGFARRRLRLAELVGWRQDWGLLSPSPFGSGGVSVAKMAWPRAI